MKLLWSKIEYSNGGSRFLRCKDSPIYRGFAWVDEPVPGSEGANTSSIRNTNKDGMLKLTILGETISTCNASGGRGMSN